MRFQLKYIQSLVLYQTQINFLSALLLWCQCFPTNSSGHAFPLHCQAIPETTTTSFCLSLALIYILLTWSLNSPLLLPYMFPCKLLPTKSSFLASSAFLKRQSWNWDPDLRHFPSVRFQLMPPASLKWHAAICKMLPLTLLMQLELRVATLQGCCPEAGQCHREGWQSWVLGERRTRSRGWQFIQSRAQAVYGAVFLSFQEFVHLKHKLPEIKTTYFKTKEKSLCN